MHVYSKINSLKGCVSFMITDMYMRDRKFLETLFTWHFSRIFSTLIDEKSFEEERESDLPFCQESG
jgi:hypothetical protein